MLHYPTFSSSKIFTFILLFLFLNTSSFADEPVFVKQSIRARGMGNAFTAAANDENTLFYNPAGFQTVQKHMIEVLTVNVTANDTLMELSKEKDTAKILSQAIGKKLYAELNLGVLSVNGPGWGYSLFGQAVIDIQAHNPSIPFFDVRAYYQYGAAYGKSFSLQDDTVDIGFGIKAITRTGVDKTFHVSDPAIVEYLDSDKSDLLMEEFSTVTAISPDAGITFKYEDIHNFPLKFSLVAKNIGGMDFGKAGEIPMTLDSGVAAESELAGFDFIMAADYVDLMNKNTKYRSWRRNLKLGVEVGWMKIHNGHHILSARAGLNGTYPTYGASVNLPFIGLKIDYVRWSEEIGWKAGDKEDKRQSIQVSLIY